MPNKIVLPHEGKSIQLGGVGVIFKHFGVDTGVAFVFVEDPMETGHTGRATQRSPSYRVGTEMPSRI